MTAPDVVVGLSDTQRVTLTAHRYYVSFTVERLWNEAEWDVDVEGSLRFDGCMNWTSADACAVHFCGPEDVEAFAAALRRVYEECKARGWLES